MDSKDWLLLGGIGAGLWWLGRNRAAAAPPLVSAEAAAAANAGMPVSVPQWGVVPQGQPAMSPDQLPAGGMTSLSPPMSVSTLMPADMLYKANAYTAATQSGLPATAYASGAAPVKPLYGSYRTEDYVPKGTKITSGAPCQAPADGGSALGQHVYGQHQFGLHAFGMPVFDSPAIPAIAPGRLGPHFGVRPTPGGFPSASVAGYR